MNKKKGGEKKEMKEVPNPGGEIGQLLYLEEAPEITRESFGCQVYTFHFQFLSESLIRLLRKVT